jgi:mycothiol synthase
MNSDSDYAIVTGSVSSRLYESEHDLLDMQDMLMAARALTGDWHYAHVGELLFTFFMVACHLNPLNHIRLWHNKAGKLVGYAIMGEDPAFDFQVLPKYEWIGIENKALAWGESLVAELRRRDEKLWSGPLVSGSRQDNTKRITFLEQCGFRPGGEFSEVNMVRSLDERIPAADLPTDIQIRPVAEKGESSDRATLHRAVWQPWTVGHVDEDEYAYFMQLPGYHRDLDIVAVTPDGVMAAYMNGWIDPVNRIGDIGPVGAHPQYRRQGLTRAVLLYGLRQLQTLGMNRVCISTGVSNTPALRLYESIGFKIVNRYLEYVKMD